MMPHNIGWTEGLMMSGILWVIVFVGLWESVWRAIALWKAARRNHRAWFVVLFIDRKSTRLNSSH
jgi:hypothetical protein